MHSALILKASSSSLESILRLLPYKLDHPGIVVAIPKIVVQRGKAVFLAVLLHVLQLGAVELRIVDIAPVTGC